MKKTSIPIILGPTSSGKTSLALKIAAQTGAIIISADSRQVYKHMDIGTGKIPVDQKNVKIEKNEGFWKIDDCAIWGYDLVNPDQTFSAYDFSVFAIDKIKELISKNIPVIVVGGTGFFVDVLTGKIKLNSGASDLTLRNELEQLSTDKLLLKLQNLSQGDFEKIDKNNRVRIIRAIERNLNTSENSPVVFDSHNFDFKYFGLTSKREVFYKRADLWAEKIWTEKFFDEIKNLHKLGYKNSIPLKGIVYKTGEMYLDEKISFEEGLQRIKFDLHAYIRRQQTWFKKNSDIYWLDLDNLEGNALFIEKSLYN